MNILRGIPLTVLVFLLAACGASAEVPDIVTETAELELQIVTSLSDSQTIDYVEVTDEEGRILYSASNFVNRFHTLELKMGKPYRITAQADVNDHLRERGTVSLTTEVTLVAQLQSVVLDLRQANTPWFEGAEDRSSIFLSIARYRSGGSLAPDLQFVGGSYTSYAILPIDAVYVHFGRDTLWWSEGSVTLTPEIFGEIGFDFTMLEIQYPEVPSMHCTFDIGVFNLSWEDEYSRRNEQHRVSVPCRG